MAEASKVDPDAVAPYLGRYHDPDQDEEAVVEIHDHALTIRNSEGQRFDLWAVPGQGVWLVRQNPVVVISFQKNDDGRVVSLTRIVTMTGQQLVMPRVD
jgi:hypothetical protein